MSDRLSADYGLPARCDEHYAQHPSKPHLVAVCTLPPGHDGEHSNVLPKAGASGGTPTKVFSSDKPGEDSA